MLINQMINVPTYRHYAWKVAGIMLLIYCPEASDCNLAILRFVLKCPCDVGFAFAVMSFTRFFATQLKNRSTSSLFKSWPATQTLESMGTWPNVSMQHARSMTLQNNALWVVAVKNFFSKSGDDFISLNSLQQCKANKNVKSEGLWSPPRFTASRKVDTEYSNLSTASSGSSASDVTRYSLQWSHLVVRMTDRAR